MELPTSQPVLCVIKSKKRMSQKPKKSFKGQNMTINVRYHKLEMVSMIISHHASKTAFSGPEGHSNDCPLSVHLTSGIWQHQNTEETTRPSAGSYEINALIDIYRGADVSVRVTTPTNDVPTTPRPESWLGCGAQSSTGMYWRRVRWMLACPDRKACTQRASPKR